VWKTTILKQVANSLKRTAASPENRQSTKTINGKIKRRTCHNPASLLGLFLIVENPTNEEKSDHDNRQGYYDTHR
jgi:hypothetical protein